MAFRFEFDAAHKILLMRFEGRLTDESLAEVYQAIRKNATATEARAGIWDFSSVSEFTVSSEFIRYIASLEPATPNSSAVVSSLSVIHWHLVWLACFKLWQSAETPC